MQTFLETIEGALSVGQQGMLQRFLADAQAGRVPADPAALQRALDAIGELLAQPDADPTTPEGFNSALRTLLANIAGLYQEVDQLEAIQDGLTDLSAVELGKIELALADLATVLASTQQANAANIQYTDVFFETFGAEIRRETAQEWYKPLPLLASGQVESFLPLAVDPADRTLKLFPGGDFLRSTNAQGDALVQVEVEEILGLSVDPNHGIEQALNGQHYTYWRELVLAEAPISADPLQVPWLPETYQAGTAARIHFQFPFAVPFTEIVLKPFSRFPVQILQIVWDNRNEAVVNAVRNGSFASGGTFWTSGATTSATLQYHSSGGYLNGPDAAFTMASGRTTLTSTRFLVTGTQDAYHLHYKLYRDAAIAPQVLVNWYTGDGNLLRGDWGTPTTRSGEWSEFSRLFLAPSGAVSGSVVLVADGSGSVAYTDASFSITAGNQLGTDAAGLDSDNLVVQLATHAAGTDVWIVVAQPHYEFLQVAIPEGDLNTAAMWDDLRLQSEATAEQVFDLADNPWQLQRGTTRPAPNILREDGSTLLREARRLGGRVRDMVVHLLQFAQPSTITTQLNRYLYVMGAWSIEIRHREYAPQGLFVSLPYHPQGEVREVILQTDPALSRLDKRIRFWLTARATDKADKAQLFTGRARFASSTEQTAAAAPTQFVLPPVTRRDTFDGTDRLGRAALPQHPYVNRETVWTVQAAISSGTLAAPLAYDPNKAVYYIDVSGNLTAVPGYRPLQVTLQFDNGTIARPDTLGRVQTGDIGLVGPEILQTASVQQELQLFRDTDLQKLGIDAPAVQQGSVGSGPINRIVNRGNAEQFQKRQQRRQSQLVTLTALQTQNTGIVTGPNGVTLSLYWHRSGDDTPSGGIVTTHDVLISPARYTVNAENGVIILRESAPSGNVQYDRFVAYYYYHRDEIGAREALDARNVGTRPTSGVDFAAAFTQALPVTRNVTDYIHGEVARLRPVNLDDLDPGYYPVYEYLVDNRGQLVFANSLFQFGDTPARVIVEYESLEIEPRLLVEFTKGQINEFSTISPILGSYTLYMNCRR